MILPLVLLYGNNRNNKPAYPDAVQKEPEYLFRKWNILPHTSFWGKIRNLSFQVRRWEYYRFWTLFVSFFRDKAHSVLGH
jgi:hypothetical protein